MNQIKRIPKHIGIIPDGNRRWAKQNNYEKHEGYSHGILPGFKLYELMLEYGIKEATFYGFTQDNTKRPKIETESFVKAAVEAVNTLANKDANLLVIGNTASKVFPEELKKYANRRVNFGRGLININFLVNYDWNWDLLHAFVAKDLPKTKKVNLHHHIASSDISRIDLIIRWGGRRRLSGFLPVQSVYADYYFVDDYWPDFKEEHFIDALNWYQTTDRTLGG
ncbi:polyprenyl diphosphate synthase [Vulcanibacillus modesticaldus]|nr:polyprenyl diphosphate synthase [Vulcanibacillus modesticaldus]